jgi:SNF2 family DNA or RNA helicase
MINTFAKQAWAPGARILVRDEEWLVKQSLPTSTGGSALRVVGLSELVRNHEAIFLSNLEEITELNPEETKLVTDDSPRYRRSRLYLESLLRRTPPTDSQIVIGHKGALNPADYQLEPAARALEAIRPRVLIADGVGLGKTVEVGILMSELIKRGRGERILVIAIKSMLAQFQEEIWARFSIPLVRLDSVGLQRVRAKIPASKNPFYYYNRAIISIDTLKNDAQYRHYLEQCRWDIIVIDECHNVANSGSQRHRLADLLARTCDSLILTSATPHNGRPESFANLINMLEPTAIADTSNYKAEEISGLFVRRFKKDIEDQVQGQFSERQSYVTKESASAAEERFFNALADAKFSTLSTNRKGQDALYRVSLLKGFLSSPDACLQTLNGRIRTLARRYEKLTGEPFQFDEDQNDNDEPDESVDELILKPDEEWEIPLDVQQNIGRQRELADGLKKNIGQLSELKSHAEAITDNTFSKYRRLTGLMADLDITGKNDKRIIIFSERIKTLDFLYDRLKIMLGLKDASIVKFHAGLPDTEQQRIVESFGKQDSKLRILLASNVASEGVNLHYYCHHLVHFDIPWSLITLEQRNGRIDRYGQKEKPQIYFLLNESKNEKIKGDLRVIERLIEKEKEAHKNLGDVAQILKLYDADQEEAKIAKKMADSVEPDQLFDEEESEDNWLANILADASELDTPSPRTADRTTFFQNDLEFAQAAFEELHSSDSHLKLVPPEFHATRPEFVLRAPEDLQRRCQFMPREALPADWGFHLTTDRDSVMNGIAAARKEEGVWPKLQLFWEMHPVMDWLLDNLLVRFGRHEAPVLIDPTLPSNQAIFLCQYILSNQRSQPLLNSWIGIKMTLPNGQPEAISLEDVMAQTGFVAGIPNRGEPSAHIATCQQMLPSVVNAVAEVAKQARLDRGQALSKQLREDQHRLKKWYDGSQMRLAGLDFKAKGAKVGKVLRDKQRVKDLFEQRSKWLNETYKAVKEPYIRVAIVFVNE